MSATKPMTRDEIGAAIARKAWADEAFHQAVLADPGAAYAKHVGQPLPPGLTIKVVEDTPDTVHFVIPARPAAGELSDAELESVAGGVTFLSFAIAGAVAGVASAGVAASAVTGMRSGW